MRVPYFSTSSAKMLQLMKVARGETPADIAIINGDLVNVYTGEVQKQQSVLVKGNCIAFVGEKPPASACGPDTTVIDAKGKVLIPGLIDGHTHVDERYFPDELSGWAIKGSTTTIITETAAIGSLMGYEGVMGFIRACRNQPVRFFFTAPPIICVSPSAEKHSALTMVELKQLLRRKDVVGLGEVSWAQLDENHRRLLEEIAETLNSGKVVDGHGAGARGEKLQAFFATGISSCHEPTTMEEVLERLRIGVFVPIREGEVRRDLPETSKIKNLPINRNLLGISADGVDPRQLVNHGYMDYIVQKAINHGFAPVEAIQMASINVARHFGLNYLGGIAPGKLADISIIPDLNTIKAEKVILNGEIAFENGEVTARRPKSVFPTSFYKSVHLDKQFSASDFNIRIKRHGTVNFRVIDQVSELVTKEAVIPFKIQDGLVDGSLQRDILKVAVIDRYWEPGQMAVGLIRGFGLKQGAIATTTCWDCAHIVVIGANEADMACAVNRIRELQGGTVVCDGGAVQAELPLRVAGLFSDEPVAIMAERYNEIQLAAQKLGTKLPDIHMSMQVLVTPSIPFLRISERGLFDLKQNRAVSLIVE
jgi:adenine deaminase